MKERKKLSDLSDEQLSDILVASITSYNVYLEEHANINKNKLVSETVDKIKYEIFNPTSPQEIEKTAIEVREFIQKFNKRNVYTADNIASKLMDVYIIKYSDLNPFELWAKAKDDSKTLINREVVDFLKSKLNYNPEQFKTLVNCVNQPSDPYPLIIEKETLLEKDILTKINLKEIKASLVGLEYSKNLRSIEASYIGRTTSNYLNIDDKTSNVVLINNGMFSIAKSKYRNSTSDTDIDQEQDREEFGACFNAFFKKENGEDVLHIGFRGTEPKAQELIKYALDDYMNMERHYDLMEPLINEIIEKAKTERGPNNPLKVKVAGHSLGAAMVEKFLEKNKDTDTLKFSGVAIASPGSENKANILIDFAEKTKFLKYPFSLITNIVVGLCSIPLITLDSGLTNLSKFKYLSFLKVGHSALEGLFSYKEEDSRLINVNHENDLVPLIGSLAYKTQKNEVILSDVNQDEGAMTNHKSYNYYGEIAKEIIKRPQMYCEFKSVFFVEEAMNNTSSLEKVSSGKMFTLEMDKITDKIREMKDRYLNSPHLGQSCDFLV